VASCCIFTFYKDIHTLLGLLLFHIFTGLVTGYFVKLNWNTIKPVLVWNNFNWLRLLAYSSIAITSAVFVNYTTSWLNHSIFFIDFNYYLFFKPHKYSIALMVLFTAVLPALLEELAYRGYLLQVLMKVMDKQQAIFITSVLFALVHLSVLSLFWLVPFAWLLGHVAVKEKTIWYGVVIHFLFNLTACFFDLYSL